MHAGHVRRHAYGTGQHDMHTGPVISTRDVAVYVWTGKTHLTHGHIYVTGYTCIGDVGYIIHIGHVTYRKRIGSISR